MKIAVKEICYRNGLRATFLGKITNDPEFPVSGYHLHQSLRDRRGNDVMADPSGPLGLSDIGRHYGAGVPTPPSGTPTHPAPTCPACTPFTPRPPGPHPHS